MKGCHSKAEIFLAMSYIPFYVNYDVSVKEKQIQQIHKQMYIFIVYIMQAECNVCTMHEIEGEHYLDNLLHPLGF